MTGTHRLRCATPSVGLGSARLAEGFHLVHRIAAVPLGPQCGFSPLCLIRVLLREPFLRRPCSASAYWIEDRFCLIVPTSVPSNWTSHSHGDPALRYRAFLFLPRLARPFRGATKALLIKRPRSLPTVAPMEGSMEDVEPIITLCYVPPGFAIPDAPHSVSSNTELATYLSWHHLSSECSYLPDIIFGYFRTEASTSLKR